MKARTDKWPGGREMTNSRVRSRHGSREFAFLHRFLSSCQVNCTVAAGIEGLDLDLTETVLPDGGEGGHTVLTEVDEHVPGGSQYLVGFGR